jgi:hypothetical protein
MNKSLVDVMWTNKDKADAVRMRKEPVVVMQSKTSLVDVVTLKDKSVVGLSMKKSWEDAVQMEKSLAVEVAMQKGFVDEMSAKLSLVDTVGWKTGSVDIQSMNKKSLMMWWSQWWACWWIEDEDELGECSVGMKSLVLECGEKGFGGRGGDERRKRHCGRAPTWNHPRGTLLPSLDHLEDDGQTYESFANSIPAGMSSDDPGLADYANGWQFRGALESFCSASPFQCPERLRSIWRPYWVESLFE